MKYLSIGEGDGRLTSFGIGTVHPQGFDACRMFVRPQASFVVFGYTVGDALLVLAHSPKLVGWASP